MLYDAGNGHRRVSKRADFVVDEAREIRFRSDADEFPTQPDWPAVQAALPATP